MIQKDDYGFTRHFIDGMKALMPAFKQEQISVEQFSMIDLRFQFQGALITDGKLVNRRLISSRGIQRNIHIQHNLTEPKHFGNT